MAEWRDESDFQGLLSYWNKMVHVESAEYEVEGYLRIYDFEKKSIVLERYERSFDPIDGFREIYPGNQMDVIKLIIPLIEPKEPGFVVVNRPSRVVVLAKNEITATRMMDTEDFFIPDPPKQLVPVIYKQHEAARMVSELHRNMVSVEVVHLSFGEQPLTSIDNEYLNSKMGTGLEGIILDIEAVNSNVQVTFEIWERYEFGQIYVRRSCRPKVVSIYAPWGCRRLDRVGQFEFYYLN